MSSRADIWKANNKFALGAIIILGVAVVAQLLGLLNFSPDAVGRLGRFVGVWLRAGAVIIGGAFALWHAGNTKFRWLFSLILMLGLTLSLEVLVSYVWFGKLQDGFLGNIEWIFLIEFMFVPNLLIWFSEWINRPRWIITRVKEEEPAKE